MSSFLIRHRSSIPSETADIPELDVTPVMNMFIILIPFLVSMAVFTHLAILRFSLPPNVGTGLDNSQGKPRLKLTVVMTDAYCAVTLGEKLLDSIPLKAGEYDLAVLSQRLEAHRADIDIRDEAVLAVRDNIAMKNVVAVMDRVREAGFESIGLSNATEDPDNAI